jgi:epoxide hydrolase-like predicted phosphatase
MEGSRAEEPLRGLIVDWGGVLTPPLDETMAAWARRDGVDFAHFRDVLADWVGLARPGEAAAVGGDDHGGPVADGSPIHLLERGELTGAHFEIQLAEALAERGSPVAATGLLTRILEGLDRLDASMVGLVRRARQAGIRTALLSNSWGDHYPEELWDGLFDEIVISGRVGMRKPEPAIYRHTAASLELDPAVCVMVDDLPRNIRAAVDVGMVGVLHRDYAQTLAELSALFGRDDLAPDDPAPDDLDPDDVSAGAPV